jgi:hypothetical protein
MVQILWRNAERMELLPSPKQLRSRNKPVMTHRLQ